jgi:hypothetical protein
LGIYYHKIDSWRWLTGSIRRQLTSAERGVWHDFIALAGTTQIPRRGYIERSEGVPYEKSYLLIFLDITSELYDSTVEKCIKDNRLQVFPDGTMYVVNWEKYNGLDNYNEKKKLEKEKREAKAASIEKFRKTQKTKDDITVALMRQVNNLAISMAMLTRKLEGNVSDYNVTENGDIVNKISGEIIGNVNDMQNKIEDE